MGSFFRSVMLSFCALALGFSAAIVKIFHFTTFLIDIIEVNAASECLLQKLDTTAKLSIQTRYKFTSIVHKKMVKI